MGAEQGWLPGALLQVTFHPPSHPLPKRSIIITYNNIHEFCGFLNFNEIESSNTYVQFCVWLLTLKLVLVNSCPSCILRVAYYSVCVCSTLTFVGGGSSV